MSTFSLRVLTYHRILPRAAAGGLPLVSATPEGFDRQMRYLSRRFHAVSLAEVLDAQRGARALPRRAVLITFDDAYSDFAEWAAPVLRRYQLPATLFVPTAYPAEPSRTFWWDRIHGALTRSARTAVAIPGLGSLPLHTAAARKATLRTLGGYLKSIPHERAMATIKALCEALGEEETSGRPTLDWSELRLLSSDGITLAAHTRTHPILTQISVAAVRSEIRRSLDDLTREIGVSPPALCYPAGVHDDSVAAAARAEGVEIAFTCLDGHNLLPSADPLRLRRTNITMRTSAPVFQVRLHRVGAALDAWRHRPRRRAAGSIATVAAGHALPTARVAYLMSRFPKLSETFVLNEIAQIDAAGIKVELFPLLRERQKIAHPEARAWTEKAHFHPFISREIIGANLSSLRSQPRDYLGVLAEVLRGAWGSANFLAGAIGIFPKCVLYARRMQDLGVTHIHAHFATHPTVAALIIHRLTGIPFSFTAHGSDLHVERRMLDRKVAAADFAIAVSDYNREVMVAECSEAVRRKIHVIHCGTDVDLFFPASRDFGDAGFELVCVASLEEVKGHRFLLEACRLLLDRDIDFRCHLVGDGPLQNDIAIRINRLGLGGRVLLHGARPRREVAELLAKADAAVLASHPTRSGKREGIPVALMEAMAAGLPVVASNISGIPELVTDEVTGLLVPSGDPGALAGALERMAREETLRTRMGSAGRTAVLHDYDLRKNAAALAALFTRPISVPKTPAPVELTTAVNW